MFDRVWKDQIQKPKGKLGIWKPKEELKPREDKRTNCKEKLIKISEFWQEYRRNYLDNADKNIRNDVYWRNLVRKEINIEVEMNDIPEEVCCDFIDFINRVISRGLDQHIETHGSDHRSRYENEEWEQDYKYFYNTELSSQNRFWKESRRIELSLSAPPSGWLVVIDLQSDSKENTKKRDMQAEDIISYMKRQFGE
mgnify:CR=1 FL=1